MERTDDDSIPKTKADKIYTGTLNNSNEALYLFDNNCQIEDEVLANPDWPAGDNSQKKPMERLNNLYWYTSASAGTPKKDNETPPPVLTRPSAPLSTPISTSLNYPQILIKEIQTESENNQKDDFVKLYNPNDETVDLTDWYIQRKTSESSNFLTYAPKSLFSGKTIQSQEYFIIANASSSFATFADAITTYALTKNNILFLKNPNGEITDQKKATSTENNESDNENNKNASTTGSLIVIFNEIAWSGSQTNSSDEWIELYNNTTSTIDLTDWKIIKDNEDWITFSTSSIAANGYYLLERSDDDQTISDIAYDQFFTGALNNNGNKLELKNSQGDLIDIIDASNGWFADNNDTKQTMERINSASSSDSSNWTNNNRITINGLDVANNSINGTPKSQNSVSKLFTEVVGDRTFIDNFTLTKLGSPYTWEGSLIIEQGAKLTVEPGVTIKFKHTAINQPHAQIKIKGEMEAIGTEQEKIIFTSFEENNYWDGIYFENSTSTLENVIINYAGKLHKSSTNSFAPYTYGAIYIEGGGLNIKNSLIENSETFSIWLKNSLSLIDAVTFKENPGTEEKPAAIYIENGGSTIKDSIFENNNIAILAENYSDPTIINNNFNNNETPIKITSLLSNISENTTENNNINGIIVQEFGFNEETNQIFWQKNNLPYIIDNNLTITAGMNLEIESGVIIKFKGNGAINTEGTIIANGQPNDKIIFTSISDDEYGGDTNNDENNFQPAAGQWKFIKFLASSINSILNNTIIRYGGFLGQRGGVNDRDGALIIENNTLLIKDSVIEKNRVGIEMINSDFDENSQNISINNNRIGIYAAEGTCPNLSKIIFEQNTEYDIWPSDCNN